MAVRFIRSVLYAEPSRKGGLVDPYLALLLVNVIIVAVVGVVVALYVRNEIEDAFRRLDISRRPVSEYPLGDVDRLKYDLGRRFKEHGQENEGYRQSPAKMVQRLQEVYGPEWAKILQEAANRHEG